MHKLNKETSEHCKRVSYLAYQTAMAYGLNERICKDIRLAGLLHDIGKMKIPLEILEKPGKLTDSEYCVIKQHPEIGASIIGSMESASVKEMVLYHHENVDGSGYYGLIDEDIPIGAKIIHICDVFDAMISKRCYKEEMDQKAVIEWMKSQNRRMFDKEILKSFYELM